LEAYKATHDTERDPDFDDPINEDNISYEPSKIDEFIAEAKKDVELGRSLINKFGSTIVNATLISIFGNMSLMTEAHSKVVKAEEYMKKKFNKFFDIVNVYEVGELPNNVRELEKISDEIDNLSYSLSDLSDGFEELINATKTISKNNRDLFTTQTIN
jgi:hypothetical protein